MATNIGPKIGVEGAAEYRKQMNQIISQAKELDSEMKLVTSTFTKETSAEEKNAVSHRKHALEALKVRLDEQNA